MAKSTDFPLDDDGMVLKTMRDRGVDLSKPKHLEFNCYAKDQEVAEQISRQVCPEGFNAEIFENEEADCPGKRFSVYFLSRMIPDYHEIVRIQKRVG